MATDDQQVLVTGQAAAPTHFTIPGNGQIQPKAIFATYDGTGAAAPFVPALKIISDGGELVGIYPTSSTVAAGGSADVSWFPRLSSAVGATPVPGQILNAYAGNATALDFTTNSNVFVDSGFPTNPTYNKVSGTSALLVVLLADITPGAAPDVIFCGTFIDGINFATTGVQISSPASFVTAPATSHIGLGGSTSAPLAAGAHTVKVRVACNSGTNFTLRCSTSVALSILEYEF